MSIPTDADYALERDRADPLARFRDEFVIDDPDLIYLDGNSLGRLPKRTAARLREGVGPGRGGAGGSSRDGARGGSPRAADTRLSADRSLLENYAGPTKPCLRRSISSN